MGMIARMRFWLVIGAIAAFALTAAAPAASAQEGALAQTTTPEGVVLPGEDDGAEDPAPAPQQEEQESETPASEPARADDRPVAAEPARPLPQTGPFVLPTAAGGMLLVLAGITLRRRLQPTLRGW